MPRVVSGFAQRLVHSRGARLSRQFDCLTADCQATQENTLQRILTLNAGSRWQRDFGLSPGLSADAFRSRVPLTTYDDLAHYIEDERAGQFNALCGRRNRPLMFALTSGTTGSTKSIPITSAFLKAYRRGWMVWAWHAFEEVPQASQGKFLQLLSPHDQHRAPSGLPCGNISGLVQAMQNRFVRTKFVIPPQITQVADPTLKRYLTLRQALAEPNVTLVSTANPSTLIQLARQAEEQKESLIRDIQDGTLSVESAAADRLRQTAGRLITRKNPDRARELSRIAERTDCFRPRDYWPRAALVAVWTGGSAAAYLPLLREWYPDLPIRDHGLAASEGRMTIPIANETAAGVLDVGSHFFEFIPESQIDQPNPETLLAHQLEVGATYSIILTTVSGLSRYNICDVVRCTGDYGTAPTLEFLHKGAHIANLTGEKLSESQVVAAVTSAAEVLRLRLHHFTLCPVWNDPPGYCLLVEETDVPRADVADQFARIIDRQLRHLNCEYEDKRASDRLAPVTLHQLPPDTWTRYIQQQQSRPGATAEQYKHPCLKPDLEFFEQVTALASEDSQRESPPTPEAHHATPHPHRSGYVPQS